MKVTFFGKPSNLHTFWDSQLVDEEQLSFTELAAKLERHIRPEDVVKWWDVNPRDWISESAQIRDTLYPTSADMPKPPKGKKKLKKGTLPELSYTYVFKFTPVMERRLSQAGVRLAAYLNYIFSQQQLQPVK